MQGFSRRATLGMIGVLTLPGAASGNTRAPSLVPVRTGDGRISQVAHWPARWRRGTILFSHGALSAPVKYEALILQWVAAGFDVWAPLHVDSTEHPDTKAFPGLASWPARIADLRALADHVGARRYVAAGHSYGALVALTLGGVSPVRPAGISGPLADRRVSCALAFSPPGPGMGLIEAAGYATLAVPALVQTGTRDVFPGQPADGWRSHLTAFDAPPAAGNRYAVVLDGVDHYFGGAICRTDLPGPRQSAQLATALTLSQLFLDGFAQSDRAARARLDARADGCLLRRR